MTSLAKSKFVAPPFKGLCRKAASSGTVQASAASPVRAKPAHGERKLQQIARPKISAAPKQAASRPAPRAPLRQAPKLSAPAKRPAPPAVLARAPVAVAAPKRPAAPASAPARPAPVLVSAAAATAKRPAAPARAPVRAAAAATGPLVVAQAHGLAGCSPCTLDETIDFCVRFTVPQGFDVTQGTDACAAVQSDGVTCNSLPCEQTLSGVTLPNPCDPLSFITCTGTVTLYKLHLGGAIEVLVNLPVSSTNPGDILSCPGATTIQLSRQLCVPVDNVVCIGCTPIDCSVAGLALVSSVVVSPPVLVLPGDLAGCEAIWQVQGTIVLNTAICGVQPPPEPLQISGTVHCLETGAPASSFTVHLFDMTNTEIVPPSSIDPVTGAYTVYPPGDGNYTVQIWDSFNVPITSQGVAIVGGASVTNLNFDVSCEIITGQVTEGCTPPVDLTTYDVALYDDPFTGQLQATTSITADGYWFMAGVAAGSYTLTVRDGSGNIVYQATIAVAGGTNENFGLQEILCPGTLMTVQGCICDVENLVTPGFTYDSSQLYDANALAVVQFSPNVTGLCTDGVNNDGYQFTNVPPGLYEVQLLDGLTVIYVTDPFAPTTAPTTTFDINC